MHSLVSKSTSMDDIEVKQVSFLMTGTTISQEVVGVVDLSVYASSGQVVTAWQGA